MNYQTNRIGYVCSDSVEEDRRRSATSSIRELFLLTNRQNCLSISIRKKSQMANAFNCRHLRFSDENNENQSINVQIFEVTENSIFTFDQNSFSNRIVNRFHPTVFIFGRVQ